jgi:hypothetical protein
MTKSRMIWVENEACMWNAKYWLRNLKGRDLGVGVINFKDGGDTFC